MGSLKNEKPIDVFILPTKSIEKEEPTSPESFWHVDKEMLRFKVHYFLFGGGVAASVPYAVVFAKDRLGISASSLGAVLTTQMFLYIFTKTLIGYLADYFNKLKAIISILTIINTVGFFILLALPSIKIDKLQNSSDAALENLFKAQDIKSKQCEKYHERFYKTVFKHSSNVVPFEYSSLDFTKSLLVTDTCYSFPETDFEKVLRYYINLFSNPKERDSNKTNEILNSNNISNDFKILVLLPKNIYLNATMCHFSTISLIIDSSKNKTNKFEEEEQCTFKSASMQKYNSDIFSDVEFQCTFCDYQNQTLDPLKTNLYKFPRKKDIETYQFWVFALIYTISGICSNAIFTLTDTACCESIQKHGADFGQQRLWGAIGWGGIAPLVGFINDSTGDFLASYILMGVMMALYLWNMSKLDLVKPHYSKNILKDVGTVLQSKDFLVFEAVVFVNGLAVGIIWYYLIWFLNSIGGSDLLCGLTFTVQSFVGTIPFMFFSSYIIKKFGHFNILIISLLGYTIRFLWYSYLYNPWLVLPVEFLHGVTYGLYYTTLASYAKQSAKPGTEATTQAIIFSTHEGLGSGIGCVLSGIGFDYFGGHQTFFYSSMLCLSGALVSLILSLHLRSRQGIIKVAPA